MPKAGYPVELAPPLGEIFVTTTDFVTEPAVLWDVIPGEYVGRRVKTGTGLVPNGAKQPVGQNELAALDQDDRLGATVPSGAVFSTASDGSPGEVNNPEDHVIGEEPWKNVDVVEGGTSVAPPAALSNPPSFEAAFPANVVPGTNQGGTANSIFCLCIPTIHSSARCTLAFSFFNQHIPSRPLSFPDW